MLLSRVDAMRRVRTMARKLIFGASGFAFTFAFALAATPASAQQAGGAEGAESDTSDTIIVTARRREELLLDVPAAISAFGAQQIEDFQLTDLQDFIQLTPGGVITESAVGVTTDISLRGVGTPGDLIEPGVGVYVDDVYVGGLRTALPSFYDMQRVEVMRGPQGALYGRNASGGAVNFVTTQPVLGEFEAEGEASYRTFEDLRLSGTLNIPLAQSAALRLNAWGVERNDGRIENVVNGEAIDQREMSGGRVGFRVEPNETTSIYLSAEYTQEDRPTGQLFYAAGAPSAVGFTESRERVARDTLGFFDTEFLRLNGQLATDLSFAELTLIGGYRTYNLDALEDQDFSARLLGDIDIASLTGGLFTPFSLARQEEVDSSYVEARLVSSSDGPFTWLIGANYFADSGDFRVQNLAGPPLVGTPYVFLGLPDPPFPAFTPSTAW
jgi:iron complex outermembrane receptor protein